MDKVNEFEHGADVKPRSRGFRKPFSVESNMHYRAENADDLINNPDKIIWMINHHHEKQCPRLAILDDYTKGKNSGIYSDTSRRNEDGKADHRAAHNFAKVINLFDVGYNTGNPIKKISESERINEIISEHDRLNDAENLDGELWRDFKKYGRAYELQVERYSENGVLFNKKAGGFFKIGTTSEALKSINVKDYDITWDKSKIKKILEDHEEMSIDVIKEVPDVLENPVVVMQSKTRLNSITLFGEVYAEETPVLVAIQLSPKSKKGKVLNFAKVASAYGKNNVQTMINNSDILYVDANKKRTNHWLSANGLQLPSGLTQYGSIGTVTYYDKVVNGMNKNSLTTMGIAMRKAKGEEFSLKDSEGNELSQAQQEYFADSKVRDEEGNLLVMYHGTPNAGFTVFKDGSYFTQNEEYAEEYKEQGASYSGYKQEANNPDVYKVYLNITKPFDTRNEAEREIFENEYYGQWGMGTPLMESGLPDWMDGEDLKEFLEENEYDYDGLILDEGGTGGYEEDVKSRGLSYVVFSPEQVKNVDNVNPTDDEDIRFSVKDEVGISYESLIAKPDMKIVAVSEKSIEQKTRKNIVDEARKNVKKYGKTDGLGRLTIKNQDTKNDIVIGAPAIRHGLTRNYETNAMIALHLGEYLNNAVKINEIEARGINSTGGYILLGYGRNELGEQYPAYFVIQTLTTGKAELIEFDALYSINGKKISEAVGVANQGVQSLTSDTITIPKLLDVVNGLYSDILPLSVAEHYGNERRETKLGKSVKYSLKDDNEPPVDRFEGVIPSEDEMFELNDTPKMMHCSTRISTI